jgi:hypothetical protein
MVLAKIPTPPPAPAALATNLKPPTTALQIIEYTRKHLQGVEIYTGIESLLSHRVTKGAAAVAAVREAQVTATTNQDK